MSDISFTIRNFHSEDFNDYVQLHIEAEKFDRSGHHISSRAFAEYLGRPNYSPEEDLFVAESDGKIIGYVSLTPELGIGRGLLDCLVHPRHRRKGVATQLFSRVKGRAEELGVEVMQFSIRDANAAAKGLASRLDFKFIRHFLELKLDLCSTHLPDVKQGGFVTRQLRVGEEDKLLEIQNRSFAGTWGFNPNTIEEIVYRIHLSGTSPQDVIMAFEDDTPIGYCWTRVKVEGNAAKIENTGQIHMLGVDPNCHKKGIGKKILLTGLAHLKRKDIKVVELTVDSESHAARSLYESVGFEVCSKTMWYEKAVD